MASNKNGNKPLPLETKELVEKVFKRFDANGDGKISMSELAEVMRALGSKPSAEDLVNMMAEIDLDRDGFIDLNEFAEFHKGTAADSTELRDAFDLYDQNKDGFISAVELHSVLKSLGDKCSVEDCSRMILSVDSDGDGCVNFEEFKRMICNANNGNR